MWLGGRSRVEIFFVVQILIIFRLYFVMEAMEDLSPLSTSFATESDAGPLLENVLRGMYQDRCMYILDVANQVI